MKKEVVVLRISETEKNKWQAEAQKREQSLSEFIRYIINREIDKQ